MSVHAQEGKDFVYFDTLTTQLYNRGSWDSLIRVANEAIDQEQDWYYLRYRMGVAFYAKKDYEDAQYQFKKAYTFNPDNETNQEYLYYSLMFSGRTAEAKAFSRKMYPDLLKKINPPKNPIISSIYVEGGMASSNNFSTNKQRIATDTLTGDYKEADLSDKMIYFHLGFTHSLGKRITLYHAYSYVGIDKEKQIKFNYWPLPPFSSNNIDTSGSYKISQHQYYLQASWIEFNKFVFKPAFHLLYNNFSALSWGGDTLPPYGIVSQKTVLYEYLLSLSIQKEYRNTSLGLSASWSNLGKGTQLQGGLSLNIAFPKFYRLFSTTNLGVLSDKNKDPLIDYPKLRLFFSERFSMPLSSKIMAGITGTFGNVCHANEANGMLVYNSSDAINYKLGLDLSYYFNQHFSLSLYYNYLSKSNSYLTVYNKISSIQHFNYTNQFIIGAIQWKL